MKATLELCKWNKVDRSCVVGEPRKPDDQFRLLGGCLTAAAAIAVFTGQYCDTRSVSKCPHICPPNAGFHDHELVS